jgi:tyrosyl-tRNA synthetase
MAELMYSVVMALDSVALKSDLEIGGVDQLLNMRMCRTVMEAVGQTAEVILTTPLIEGTDGSGNKMSKSLGNYVPLSAPANEIVGKLMSIPDRLLAPYFSSVTELTAPEVAILTSASVPPKAAKELLAVDVAAALRGKEAALTALDEFRMQFGSRSYRLLKDLPEIDLVQSTPASMIEVLQNAMGDVSRSHLRRLTDQSAIRVVIEGEEGERHRVVVTPSLLDAPLSDLLAIIRAEVQTGDQIFLRVGSKLVFRLVTHE